jgi:broad specificity polyphosphatase/5'/3'-nucleotidase SurE
MLLSILSIILRTACTIVTSLIHSKLENCNSLSVNLPATQTKRMQLLKTAKFHYTSPHLESLHWLKINETTRHRALSIT